jgi:predicted glycosyltransferase
MKVSFYCQHVLGIGHFHRSLEICKALAAHHPTTLILGGPPVNFDQENIQTLILPGLEMDPEFQTLAPCDPAMILAEVKEKRRELLFTHLQEEQPDVFITELYPFGRKAFRFELDPLLVAVRAGTLPRCFCCCSVRDILVEKNTGREKFEQRVVETLNTYFDGILVHADPNVITLGATFNRLGDIGIPVHYTGFITRAGAGGDETREKLKAPASDKLIVASIGGGIVGSELLFAVISAFESLQLDQRAHLQIFCGPYCDDESYERLQKLAGPFVRVDRFTDHFPAWLQAADLSISMAGYNTCMNLLQAGIPALVYPYKQNREQRLRAVRLGIKAPIAVLEESDLAPKVLAGRMLRQLARPREEPDINLNGAAETVRQLEIWQSDRIGHD